MLYTSDNAINTQALNEIIYTYHFSTALPIQCFNSSGEMMGNSMPLDFPMFPYAYKTSFDIHKVIEKAETKPRSMAYSITNDYDENFIAVDLWHENVYYGTLIAGPVLLNVMTDKALLQVIQKNKMRSSDLQDFRLYYNKLITMDLTRFQFLSLMLYRLCTDGYDGRHSFSAQPPVNDVTHDYSSHLFNYREKYYFHIPYKLEKRYLNAMRKGDYDEFKKIEQQLPQYKNSVLCKNNPIRSFKNALIIACANYCKCAVEGGVDHHITYTMGDSYVCRIEETNMPSNLTELHKNMVLDFFSIIHKQSRLNYSPIIQRSMKYIEEHLTERISLDKVATAIHVSSNYLSKLFKQEVECSFIDYVNQKKVEEAARLLEFSNYSVLDIALFLGYSSQSYFTQIFKKHMNVTPKQYLNSAHKVN